MSVPMTAVDNSERTRRPSGIVASTRRLSDRAHRENLGGQMKQPTCSRTNYVCFPARRGGARPMKRLGQGRASGATMWDKFNRLLVRRLASALFVRDGDNGGQLLATERGTKCLGRPTVLLGRAR